MPRRNTQETTSSRVRGKGSVKSLVWLLALCVIIIVGAIFIGKSDQGQIDVNATIESSNQLRREQGGDASGDVKIIPDVFKNKPNGGLVPQGASEAEPPATEETTNTEAEPDTETVTPESEVTLTDPTE